MNKSAFFISDLHFGAVSEKAYPFRDKRFCEFLATLPNRATHLFILGDLFEFWMEYKDFIPKREFKVIAGLAALVDQGVKVHYLAGNHDFNLGGFFSEFLGIHTHHDPLALRLQDKNLLLLHGDGLADSDWKYRALKKLITHPWANHCFKLLHPDWGMRLARLVGKTSRDRHDCRPNQLNEYQVAARRLMGRGHDIIMHGHTHAAFVRELDSGVYVNCGEWFRRLEYVEMIAGKCFLRSYLPPDIPPGILPTSPPTLS